MDLLAGNLAPIPLPPPPVPPPGVDPIVYSGPVREQRVNFGGINETSIKLFATKRIRTKPVKPREDFFHRQKCYLDELQQRNSERKQEKVQASQVASQAQKSRPAAPPQPLASIQQPKEEPAAELAEESSIAPQNKQNTTEEPPCEEQAPPREDEVHEEEAPPKPDEEEIKAQQQKLEELYLKLAQRRRPVQAPKEKQASLAQSQSTVEAAGDKPDAARDSSEPNDAEIEELLQFVDELPEDEDPEADEIKKEIQALKGKIDELYAKANIYVDPKRVEPAKEKRTQPVGDATDLQNVKQLNASQLEEPEREYFDIHDIETISQRILREVKERKLHDRQAAPFLQPFVFRGK